MEDDGKSFWVLRLKVRDRIVADGIDDPRLTPPMWGVSQGGGSQRDA
ncbi:hypothetical protein IUJ34_03035 [Klebsiella pneumoniae subsp. pneumoniae]|uniref:Uncharacterized protein n=1 Tax=Klebsiella pneumoniae subsp. pneumoniae TaxID=72407 RepID=A0A7S9HFM8_KLEPN|nr:hypothetical protein IUJ34_03035 [Klebsiella pneumoniae subsp. pneumoniae]